MKQVARIIAKKYRGKVAKNEAGKCSRRVASTRQKIMP